MSLEEDFSLSEFMMVLIKVWFCAIKCFQGYCANVCASSSAA